MKIRSLLIATVAAFALSACTPPTSDTTTSPSPVTSQGAQPSVEGTSALTAAQSLTVKGRAPKTGYDRDLFGNGWLDTDNNGCDTRNDILLRDLTEVALSDDGCTVVSGIFADPYTATTINFKRGKQTSSEVQIDHMVPLSLAWQQGAQQWDTAKREAFANDPLNLLASDGPTNGSKSDSGPGSWLPPNKSFRCAYVARFTAVVLKHDLSVNQGDYDMILQVLSECPEEPLPTDDALPSVEAPTEPAAPSESVVPPVDDPAPVVEGSTDPDYGSCSAAKAAGATTPYMKDVDPEYAFYQDGDADGAVCE